MRAPCPSLPLCDPKKPTGAYLLPGRGLFEEELRGARARLCVFRVPTRAPVRMPGNRGVGREQKGGATSGSTARVLEDRGAHEGKEETEVDGRENASGCHVESTGELL